MRIRPPGQVVQLRPRAIARRSARLRGRLLNRLRVSTPTVQRLLEIVAEVLDRADQVPATDLGAWERLLTLLEELEHTTQSTPACAAVANLVALAHFDQPVDHVALADLAELLGHDELARLQHRYSVPLEPNNGLPIATEAVRHLLVGGRLRSAHALLSQGIDRSWVVPPLTSVDELVDVTERGTIVEWRHHMAMVIAEPWSPATSRVVELAQEAGHSYCAMALAALIGLCREQSSPTVRGGAPNDGSRRMTLTLCHQQVP